MFKRVSRVVARWVDLQKGWLSRIFLPGFRGSSLLQVLQILLRDMQHNSFGLRASGMAYSFFFAVFPSLIFVFALLPYIPIDQLNQKVDALMHTIMPAQALSLVQGTIDDTFERQGYAVLSFTFIVILYAATRGIRTMLMAFSKADPEHFKPMNPLQRVWRSLVIFFSLAFFVLLSLSLLILGELLLNYLTSDIGLLTSFQQQLLLVLKWVVNLLMLFVAISFIYYYAPNTHTQWHFLSPGSVLAGGLMFLAHVGLKVFFQNFANYNALYGSLAAVMILMFWFYWISMVLLLGFELNAAIDRAAAKSTPKPLPADEAPTVEEPAMELDGGLESR